MSRLELAADRLKIALDSLDKALTVRAAGAAEATKLQGRVADLESERERLLEKIATLEDELAALASVTDDVGGRLDDAIGEIRAALARS